MHHITGKKHNYLLLLLEYLTKQKRNLEPQDQNSTRTTDCHKENGAVTTSSSKLNRVDTLQTINFSRYICTYIPPYKQPESRSSPVTRVIRQSYLLIFLITWLCLLVKRKVTHHDCSTLYSTRIVCRTSQLIRV